MDEKIVDVMGLTKDQWKAYDELLAHANKEQIEKMIMIAAMKLVNKRVKITEKTYDDIVEIGEDITTRDV